MNRAALAALVALLLLLLSPAGRAQDIEPRAYSNAPLGVNFLVAGAAATRGGLAFDPSLPVENPSLGTGSAVIGYARVIELWGQSAKVDVVAPYTWLSGDAIFAGQPVSRVVDGPSDIAFRLNANLYGAPAMNLRDFMAYEQDVIVGASLRVIAPIGQYDNTRAVNIGGNRWSFKPEVGISKATGPWTFELTAAATIYTDNDDFYGGKTRSQDPIYSAQFHVIRSYPSGIWASLDATWFAGGRTTIDGVRGNDLQQNWRLGGTLAYPLDRNNSIKLYASSGISDRTGNNYDLLGIAWQYRWGGGL